MTARLPSLNGLRPSRPPPGISASRWRLRAERHADRDQHQIRRLELELGIRLFIRQNRALALTPEAPGFSPRRPRRLQRSQARHRPLQRRDSGHVLTVSTLASLAANGCCRGFRLPGGDPGIDVRITTSTALVDFNNGDVDAAIRYGRGQWPGLRADWLMADQLFPVCSPSLLTATSHCGNRRIWPTTSASLQCRQ